MAVQLNMPGGEPRYQKVKGQARYYDHATGRTISHRQYWKLRGEQKGTKPASSWTPEKEAQLRKQPATVRSQASAAAPSQLAQDLLSGAMYGSPVVETPAAPVVRKLAEDIAEDTKKSVEGLAEAISPAAAVVLILGGQLVLRMLAMQYLLPLLPEQEEAELILEPAARIVLRNFGITGKQLGPNGADMLSILAAVAAYGIGAQQRMSDYLDTIGDDDDSEQAEQQQPDISGGRRTGAAQRRTDTAVNDARSSRPTYAAVFGKAAQQSDTGASGETRSGALSTSGGPATAKQEREAASVRALFDADYAGRVRLGML